PIVRDRFHYFINTDNQDVTEPMILFDVRTDSDFLALDPAVQGAFLSRVESLLGRSLDEELDLTAQRDQETYLIKLDGNFGTNHHASARWNYADFNNFPSEGFSLRSANGDEYNTTNSLVAQAESILSQSLFNQFIFQWGLEERPIDSLAPPGVPNTEIDGGGIFMVFGRSEFLPNATDEEKFQIKNNTTWMMGNHQFKAGFEYVDGTIDNFFPREAGGEFDFDSVQDFLDNTPGIFFQGYGPTNGLNSWDYSQWGVFVQDTWNPMPNLTVDYGIRYDLQDIATPVANKFPNHPEFVENFKNDENNFAPRLGFAYDLRGDGRSVLRGGVGRFFSHIPQILYAAPLAEVAGIYNRITVPCSSGGCPTYPNILTPEEFAVFVRSAPDVTGVNSNLEAMESTRMSLGYEQQVGSFMSVGVEGVYAQLDKQQRLVNVNAVDTGRRYGDLIVYSTSSSFGALRRYPEFRDVKLHSSDAEGDYTSLTLQARGLPAPGSRFSWLAHYTWAEAIDQDSNERSTSTPFHLDPFNPEVNEGPADYDIEHRFLASGTYELPWGIMVSGILNWRTGAPHTAWLDTGSTAINGIFGIGGTPVFRDSSGNIIDMTQATGMTPDQLSAFLQGAEIEGRNQRRQPDFKNIDLRLSKRFNLFSDVGIELIGEVFNLLDEDNTIVVGSNQDMFFGSFRSGTWTFTRNANFGKENAFTGYPRQYQAAVKVLF
ncbi:MAG TPA: TonB-dependent receptor, partial [Thermoanaerobaculia bacterium]|nr:TonB-dependent receptor [Thermoanaerobaculia bacterium]